jgi:hypothetical protein
LPDDAGRNPDTKAKNQICESASAFEDKINPAQASGIEINQRDGFIYPLAIAP